jgi:hypothetical protein
VGQPAQVRILRTSRFFLLFSPGGAGTSCGPVFDLCLTGGQAGRRTGGQAGRRRRRVNDERSREFWNSRSSWSFLQPILLLLSQLAVQTLNVVSCWRTMNRRFIGHHSHLPRRAKTLQWACRSIIYLRERSMDGGEGRYLSCRSLRLSHITASHPLSKPAPKSYFLQGRIISSHQLAIFPASARKQKHPSPPARYPSFSVTRSTLGKRRPPPRPPSQ